jgi:hypothetical protein
MQASLDALKTALRVLTALTEKRAPEDADVKALRDYANGDNSRDLDELACDVIQRALVRRAAARGQL